MARLFSASDRAKVASLDSFEDVTYTPPGGADPVVVDHVLLDLESKQVDGGGGTVVDVEATITVSSDYLTEAQLGRDGVFVIVSSNPAEDGNWRVNEVLSPSDAEFIDVAVRRDD